MVGLLNQCLPRYEADTNMGWAPYNASVGQLHYIASFPNGTARPKPVLRTTSQSKIDDTGINRGFGCFRDSYNPNPDQSLDNATTPYNWTVIVEGRTEDNILASYDSCPNDNAVR